jgi:hypothetical protein
MIGIYMIFLVCIKDHFMQFLASFRTKFKQIPKEVKLLDQEARVEENTQKEQK